MGKTKSFLGIGLSILFIFLGINIFTTAGSEEAFLSPVLSKISGIAVILFFGGLLIFGVKKLFQKNS